MSRPELQPNPGPAADHLGAHVLTDLGGRVRLNWLIRQDEQQFVLRAHTDPLQVGARTIRDSIAWEEAARRNAITVGWPAATPVADPFELNGVWWTVEEQLFGERVERTADELGALAARWHGSQVPLVELSRRPGALKGLDGLADPGLDGLWAGCADPDDRRWLERRYEQVMAMVSQVNWAASPVVLVHGDLTNWNLLWRGEQLSGLLDFELATADRRMVEFVNTWRCRHDGVVAGYHARTPLTADEWPMLLVDWWATLLLLSAATLRQGRQPDRWELDGLRRSSPLAAQLQRRHLPPRLRPVPGL